MNLKAIALTVALTASQLSFAQVAFDNANFEDCSANTEIAVAYDSTPVAMFEIYNLVFKGLKTREGHVAPFTDVKFEQRDENSEAFFFVGNVAPAFKPYFTKFLKAVAKNKAAVHFKCGF